MASRIPRTNATDRRNRERFAISHHSTRHYVESGDQSFSCDIDNGLTLKVEREGDGYRASIHDENGKDWTADNWDSFAPRQMAEEAIEVIIMRPHRCVSRLYAGGEYHLYGRL